MLSQAADLLLAGVAELTHRLVGAQPIGDRATGWAACDLKHEPALPSDPYAPVDLA